MTNIALFKDNSATADIILSNASQISIGRRLVYVEFVEDGNLRIRAYGRDEFAKVKIENLNGETAVIPLTNAYKRFEAKFSAEWTTDDTTDDTAENTTAEPIEF